MTIDALTARFAQQSNHLQQQYIVNHLSAIHIFMHWYVVHQAAGPQNAAAESLLQRRLCYLCKALESHALWASGCTATHVERLKIHISAT